MSRGPEPELHLQADRVHCSVFFSFSFRFLLFFFGYSRALFLKLNCLLLVGVVAGREGALREIKRSRVGF